MNCLCRLPSVMGATGLSRATIYLRIKQGLLPAPVKLGKRAVAWPVDEVASVNAARIAGKSDDEIRSLVADLAQRRGRQA